MNKQRFKPESPY